MSAVPTTYGPRAVASSPLPNAPMTMSEKLFAEAYAKGLTPTQQRSNSAFAKGIAKAGIVRSADFQRIEALPRREWGVSQKELAAALKAPKTPGAEEIIEKAAELESLRKEMTRALRVRGGTMELWPVQAAALAELCEWKGLVGSVLAGGGKTIITILAPWMVGAKRPLLLVPASLRDQTLRVAIPALSRHWKIPHGLRILAYSELSLAKNAEILQRISPDLIIADEAQMIAAHKSGRTRRVRRFLNDHPDTMVVALSGTITRRSILDYWQLALWALKADLVPLPNTWHEVQDWAEALDEGVSENRIVAPGALRRLCGTTIDEVTKKERLETPREGYRRRLVQTPGVIATSENDLGVSLEIDFVKYQLPAKVRRIMEQIRLDWETPNGDYLTSAVEMWRHGRELSCGFWLKWDPPAPPAWMNARRSWKKYVRETLKTNRHGLDTELQVWVECETAEKNSTVIKRSAAFDKAVRTIAPWGTPLEEIAQSPSMFGDEDDYDEEENGPWYLREFVAWRRIKDTFKVNTVPVWEDLGVVRDVVERLKKKSMIAWVENPDVGDKISELSGFHYYGAGDDTMIDASGKESCIASIKAQGVGKNLQAWSENLIVSCPPSGALVEQLLARTHRFGQKSDTVYAHVYLHSEELAAGWQQSLSDAAYIEQTTGQRQRLSYARIIESRIIE